MPKQYAVARSMEKSIRSTTRASGMAIVERNRRGSKRFWLALAAAVAGMVAVGVWLVDFHAPQTSGTTDSGGQAVVLPVEPPTRSEGPLPPEPVPSAPTPSLAELTPADVMGNPDCIMRSGTGHGRDMAVVLVPAEDGLRFAVVDGSGIVFSDKLPFHSVQHSSLSRRPDGSVLGRVRWRRPTVHRRAGLASRVT